MQKLQLSIPEPCHENWQQMTPTDQGRFCNACAREVVDFSMMTDMQVLNYFSTLTHEKVCGRALPDQLNRTISRPVTPKKRLFWYWNYMVMFFMFFGKGNAAKAQGGIKPVTEINPVKAIDVRGEINAAGGVKTEGSRIITGKVTDIDGNPVSFASIKIEGTNTGVSADANGQYSIRIKAGAILEITGASFKPAQISIGIESAFNTVLEEDKNVTMGETVIVGSFRRDPDEYYGPFDRLKRVAIIHVKDETTGKVIPNASLIVQPNYTGVADKTFTDKKGMYKIKGITDYDKYEIKISANGYEPGEFTIDENDFKNRKKEWEVLLRKQNVEPTVPIAAVKPGVETTLRLGGVNIVKEGKSALFVVDGIIMPNSTDINPDDVETYTVLQGPQAMAIFGSEASNGAIVITTRKVKEKSLDTVVISTGPFWSCKKIWSEVTKLTKIENNNLLKDLGVKQNQFLIYPNPVQRGHTFSIFLKLKQTGLYQIQITDATGRTVLQKQINVLAKEFTEKMQADNRWSSGVYYINLIDNKNQLLNKSSFILQ